MTKTEALELLKESDDEILGILDGAFLIRRHYFGRDVTIHVIQNAKSGLCSEDCAFCSQAGKAHTDAPHYTLQTVEELLNGAMALLRPSERQLLWLAHAEGLSYQDISVITGFSLARIRLTLFRSRRKLAKALRQRKTLAGARA